jgi:very-short-patch-repair endonuclease
MTIATPRARYRAKQLRHSQTEAERRLWNELRDRRLGGHKFRRQVPIGPFIADFVCREKRLVVEVDGATHGEDSEVVYDQRRSGFLAAHGFRILRVNNADVYTALSDVLDTILMKLEERR